METSTLTFDSYLADGISQYGFQTESTSFAVDQRQALIADEMGLGKTISALTTLEVTGSYPALVLAPTSLRGNWLREAGKFLPWRSVQVLSGRAPVALTADIIVCGYDILDPQVDHLQGHGFAALVADEFHYLKGQSARTRAAQSFSDSLPADAVRIGLSGTPVLNRPSELLTQLQILGRLHDVTPLPTDPSDEDSWAFSFLNHYCGGVNGDYSFKGSTNAAELNARLRSTCMVRHERTAVTGLAATDRQEVVLTLDKGLSDYRKAEKDLVAWLRETKGAYAAEAAARALGISRINHLRQLSALAKLPAAFEWIDNFLAANPDRPLVIFAHHVAIQRALVEHYGCPALLGGQALEVTEAAKDLFQSGGARIIVCSLSAAGVGHTLTAASDVLFIESGWTPGANDQAADRCNRIGQTQDVIAFYLIAEGTIDERIANLIEAKRSVVDAVVIGEAPEIAILNSYAAQAGV